MGIDLLDLSFRLEKKLQIPLRPQHLFLGEHTTVSEVVELLWQRLQGLEVANHAEITRLYQKMELRVNLNPLRGWRDWIWGLPKDRELDELIPPEQRTRFWETLGRDVPDPLPPLVIDSGQEFPRFPEELKTTRRLLQRLRKDLFQQFKWAPIETLAESGTAGIEHAAVGISAWLGRRPHQQAPMPRREIPWTREELFDVVRAAIADAASVDLEKVTSDAELIHDLGMN